MAASLIMVVLCVWLGLDQIVVGIAITLPGEGITSVLQEGEFGATYPRLGSASTVSIPLLDRIPIVGSTLFEPAAARLPRDRLRRRATWAFRATNIGLNLRAAGEKPEALDAAGVSVIATRSYAVLATGFLTGLGGAYLPSSAPASSRRSSPRAGLHGDRDRHARPRAAAGGCSSARCSSASRSRSRTRCRSPASRSRPTSCNMLPFAAIIVALLLFARRSYLPPSLALPYVRGTR